jgi:deazaflavin-dependent oxidoreductase (nitroreductase family)
VVLESTGRKSGLPRRVPLATGPLIDGALWLISVHGRSSAFGRNISAQPEVRVKLRRRWHAGTARLVPIDPAILARFSLYARLGPRTLGVEPTLVQIELHPG